MQKQLKNSFNIKLSMDCSWIFNGLKIQEDLDKIINVKMAVAKEKEAVPDKTDGDEMIDGVVDRLQMTEALQVTVEIKITKTLYPYVPEI